VTVPAEAARLREIRQLVAAFAREQGAPDEIVDAAVLAVNEACSNVIRHAYGEEGGPLHVKGGCESQLLQFLVSDNGTPVADTSSRPEAGLGLKFIQRVADDVDIEGPGEHGTRVRMTFRLGGGEPRELPDLESLG
jgi:anti-sigma regulatory factor (Ser/Thr protein kinase)